MYAREKQFRQENHITKKSHHNTPSFSSSLLDEICRSIDETHQKPDRRPAQKRVEKWMENDKTVFRRRPKCENAAVFPDNDLSLFNSTSGRPSASDSDLFWNRPKPVRTGRKETPKDGYLFDEYEAHERNRAGDDPIKSKSPAMKIYANFKKLKQPISPGARLTNFINSICSGLSRKKTDRNNRTPAKKTTTCSTKPTDNMSSGIERTVQSDFTRINNNSNTNWRPPLPPNAFRGQRKCDLETELTVDDGEDEDGFSESSCELFELHHVLFRDTTGRFSEELPVYETTYFDKNRRLIR